MGDLKFCQECNNVLEPKEDEENLKLTFECKACKFTFYADPTDATENTIFRRNVRYEAKEAIIVNPDVTQDATCGRDDTYVCPGCLLPPERNDVVFYQLPEKQSRDSMTLIYVCNNCLHWEKRDKDWWIKKGLLDGIDEDDEEDDEEDIGIFRES
eukprot:Platyproteum_vivax@DN3374_c0_g1_i1.p1